MDRMRGFTGPSFLLKEMRNRRWTINLYPALPA
jgi:hypothetical protein